MKLQAKVYSRRGSQKILRRGRGFSRSELVEVGLDLDRAKAMAMSIDPKRKSKHPHNVEALKKLIQSIQSKEEESNVGAETS